MWVAALALLWAGSGRAEASPGDGLQLGPVKVDSHLGLNLQYDSNPWLDNQAERAANEAGLEEIPKALPAFGINPGIAGTIGNDSISAKASYDHYFRTYLAKQVYRRSLSYNNNFAGRLFVDVFPNGVFGLSLSQYTRNQSNTNQSASGEVIEALQSGDTGSIDFGDGLNTRLYNDSSLRFRYSPGEALDFFAGGGWSYERYINNVDDPVTGDPDVFGLKNSGGAELSGRWKFFPRTYVLLEADYQRTSYQYPTVRQLGTWSARTGVVGQFTATIQAVGLIGYGQLNNISNTNDDGSELAADDLKGAQGLVGQAILNWTPEKTQTLNLSFVRNFSDSIIADYFVNNTVSFGYSGTFYDRLETGATLGIDFRHLNLTEELASVSVAEDPQSRDDQRYRFRANAGYRIAPWLRATASYQLTILDSSDEKLDYTRHLVVVGVRGSY